MSSNQYFETLFNRSKISIFITDGIGNISEQNEFSLNQYGKIVDNNIFDYLVIEDNKDCSINELTEREYDIQIVVNDVKYATLSTTLIDSDTLIPKYMFILLDRTEYKNKELKYQDMQNRMIKSSYRDGVAESAISTLHNIGNILTSIISNIPQDEDIESITSMTKVIEKISEQYDIKEKELIQNMNETLLEIKDSILDFSKTAYDKCLNIGDIIQAQQNYANFKSNNKQNICLKEVIKDCLKLNDYRLKQSSIEVDLQLSETIVFMEKIGLSQTINNVITNSIEAIDSVVPQLDEKNIIIRSELINNFIVLSFEDNGIGIKEEELNSLFNFGYSTKNRNSGFGLHNCFNYMKTNYGNIKIYSNGEGEGTKVVLICPKSRSDKDESFRIS